MDREKPSFAPTQGKVALESLERRKLMVGGLATAASSVLAGCCEIVPKPLAVCSTAPPTEEEDKRPLAVDVHTHVFNGTDLQLSKFIRLNLSIQAPDELKKLAGEIVQALTWTFAPTGCDEYAELGELALCTNAGEKVRTERHRNEAYAHGKREIMNSPPMRGRSTEAAEVRRSQGLVAKSERERYVDSIAALLNAPNVQMFESKARQAIKVNAKAQGLSPEAQLGLQADIYVAGLIRFILQGFQYRYVSVKDYLTTYNSSGGGRSIDLMIANLVDYDWPLAMGKKTKTPLRHQVMVMERLSLFTKGQVHCMVPFDPMRMVAQAAGKHAESGHEAMFTFDDITDAVMKRGFIGVKMYPPMGFQPMCNAQLPGDTWKKNFLPGWMTQPVTYPADGTTKSFGERLDDQLEALYSWAEQNDVPITVHAEASQGPDGIFDGFAVSKIWDEVVLVKHPQLRLNFGHSGDLSGDPIGGEQLVSYMRNPSVNSPRRAYGDLSYASTGAENPEQMEELLAGIFAAPAPSGGAAARDRLMYGTDWLMLLQEKIVDRYFSVFQDVFAKVDAKLPPAPEVSDRFFAINALEWAGLTANGAGWKRLEAFYMANGMDMKKNRPTWMKKASAISLP